MQRVVFRADGNSEIGLGHVYRSLALAEMLKQDFELIFLTVDPLQEVRKMILKTCNDCIELEVGNKSEEQTKVFDILKSDDILVLDGSHFNGEYQKKVRKHCYKVISIDDLHQGHFYSDYILNHCGALDPKIYEREPYTELLLGPEYVLLRPPFLSAVRNKQYKKVESPYSVFLCMGGSDFHNITFKVIQAVQKIPEIGTLNIVLGAANQHKDRIYELVERDNRCKIYNNLSGQAMCELMIESDVAIAPASSISFEVCATGMGFISGYYADNQHDIVNWLDETGCALIVGDFRKVSKEEFQYNITSLLDSNTIPKMLKNQQIIDGYSGERLLTFFRAL